MNRRTAEINEPLDACLFGSSINRCDRFQNNTGSTGDGVHNRVAAFEGWTQRSFAAGIGNAAIQIES